MIGELCCLLASPNKICYFTQCSPRYKSEISKIVTFFLGHGDSSNSVVEVTSVPLISVMKLQEYI